MDWCTCDHFQNVSAIARMSTRRPPRQSSTLPILPQIATSSVVPSQSFRPPNTLDELVSNKDSILVLNNILS